MSDDSSNAASCFCDFFDRGDWVQSRLNSEVKGIVVGEADFGHVYLVQLAGSMETRPFANVTLRHMDEPEDEDGGKREPVADNVIKVDFTKPRTLRPGDDTEGAA
ncbi:hypothetical protein [Sinorhizobium medicae]